LYLGTFDENAPRSKGKTEVSRDWSEGAESSAKREIGIEGVGNEAFSQSAQLQNELKENVHVDEKAQVWGKQPSSLGESSKKRKGGNKKEKSVY